MGCAHEQPDPTGFWQMQLDYEPGSCNQTQAQLDVIVDINDANQLVLTSPTFELQLSGSLDGTTLTLDVRDPDVFNDGGNVQQVDSLTAMLDDQDQISGFGITNVSGLITCSQPFSVSGSK